MALVILALCCEVHAQGQAVVLAGRDTVYWAAREAEGTKQPLLLFSHGYGGCATQSKFLMEALAANGFWVFAPNHHDARCGRINARDGKFSLQAFRTPEKWDENSYADRRDDIVNLLAALKRDPQFQNKIDFSQVGLLGHSLGGYTVLGLAGAWSSWRMDGVKAVLALSPYSQPFNLKHTISNIKIPLMFQGGSRDFGTTPAVSKGAGSYEQANAPKYYIEFEGAGHFVWTDLNKKYADSICAYSIAFLNRYVKGLPASADLTKVRTDLSRFDYDSTRLPNQ